MEYIKIISKINTRGGPTRQQQSRVRAPPPGRSRRACGTPDRPSGSIFSYMVPFALEKNQKRTFGTERRRLEVELGHKHFCSPAERFLRDTSLLEGEIEAIIITNDPLIERGSISINIFTSTISSQTLVHLLYLIFVSKPQIGTCRLLVVLITPFS